MNTSTLPLNRFQKRRQAYLRQIANIGPFVEGTLVRLRLKNCRHVAHRLTFKVKRKTRTVYVPVDRIKDVEQWCKQYKRLKRLIKAVTQATLMDLKHYVRAKRAARANLARLSPRSTRSSSRPSGTSSRRPAHG
jgi:hypothetical protein